jgi:hypothetical protein
MKYILSLKNATSFYAEVAALSFGPWVLVCQVLKAGVCVCQAGKFQQTFCIVKKVIKTDLVIAFEDKRQFLSQFKYPW